GHPPTTSRITTNIDSIRAVASAVLVEHDQEVEIVDAASGQTIATFRPADLRPQNADGSARAFATDFGYRIDIEHGFLYQLGADAHGQRLWRYRLDGTGKTVMATLAPDPDVDWWTAVDYTLTEDGEVIAVSCPSEKSTASDHRCRLWRMLAG